MWSQRRGNFAQVQKEYAQTALQAVHKNAKKTRTVLTVTAVARYEKRRAEYGEI